MTRRGEKTRPNTGVKRTLAAPRFRSFGRSDKGPVRPNNEDALWYDERIGVFLVVDGVGGQAAGEMAARQAVQTIADRMSGARASAAHRIRKAIADANRAILDLANTNPEWAGMACVLTLGLIEDRRLTVGHVGDTRLYKISHGEIRKITKDHSPVGELEDSGKLNESRAMAHPRRNEVYREVGSEEHSPEDPEFIEIITDTFEADSALLFCSDGISDLLSSAEILNIVRNNASSPQRTVDELIRRAAHAGGKDNMTAIVVQGEAFAATTARELSSGKRNGNSIPMTTGHTTSPMVSSSSDQRPFLERLRHLLSKPATVQAAFAAGIVCGMVILYILVIRDPQPLLPVKNEARPAGILNVGEGKTFSTIAAALIAAQDGDVIRVGPGTYDGPISLKNNVSVEGAGPEKTSIHGSGTTASVATARGSTAGSLVGVSISGDGKAATGILLVNSNLQLLNVAINDTTESAIRIEDGQPVLRAVTIQGNLGYDLLIEGASSPSITLSSFGPFRINRDRPSFPRIMTSHQSTPFFTGNFFLTSKDSTIQGLSRERLQEFFKQNSFVSRLIPITPRNN